MGWVQVVVMGKVCYYPRTPGHVSALIAKGYTNSMTFLKCMVSQLWKHKHTFYGFTFKNYIYFILYVYMCVFERVHHAVLWRSEGNLAGLVFSSTMWILGIKLKPLGLVAIFTCWANSVPWIYLEQLLCSPFLVHCGHCLTSTVKMEDDKPNFSLVFTQNIICCHLYEKRTLKL